MMPPAENSTIPSTPDLSRQDKLDLEGYRNLSSWNHRDNQEVQSYDKVFVPLSLAGPVYVMTQDSGLMLLLSVIVGSILLLIFWHLSSLRCNTRLSNRFSVMQDIEKKLKFKGHSAVDYDSGIRNRRTRSMFFGIMLTALIILALYRISNC